MKIAILTQPYDIFTENLCPILDELNLQYQLVFVGEHVKANQCEKLFPQTIATPCVYVDGKYIADPYYYFTNDFKEREIPDADDWQQARLSDVICLITQQDCRGCKIAKEALEERDIQYTEYLIGKDLSNGFVYSFFKYEDDNSMAFPMMIINGSYCRDWDSKIEEIKT